MTSAVFMFLRLRSVGLIVAAVIALLYPLGAMAEESSAPIFEPGQEWSMTSADGAKVVIGRVEDWHNEKVIHVSVVDILVPPGLPRAGTMTEIAHAPFSYGALKGSVVKLLRTNVPPSSDFESGYKQWQDARGGVFTISAEELIALMFESVSGN